MTAGNANTKPREAPPPHWVSAEVLGIGTRQAARLFDRLKPLGAARRYGRLRMFNPENPEVRSRMMAAREDRSYEDLDAFTQKQIEDARRWLRILETGRREVAERMAATGKDRVTCVKWFCGRKCAELGWGEVSVRTFYRRSERLERAGQFKLRSQIDARGRKGSKGEPSDSPEAWKCFLEFWLDHRRRSAALCHELTVDRAETMGWTVGSLSTYRRRLKTDVPEVVRVRYREGEKAFKSQCLPRVRRTYDHLPAGDAWVGDECTMDLYVRIPDGRGGWKRGRPILTAWLDIRSRKFVGWTIAQRANSDTIVAAFKRAVRAFGPPLTITIDNGADYKCAAGRKSRKWESWEEQRLNGLFGELGCTVQWAIPYCPQSKMIESHFATVHDRFDKCFDSYCGSSPEKRPEDAMRIPVFDLPTIEEVNEAFEAFLKAHHDRPQTGEGMYNLSPNQAYEQFRPKTVREKPAEAMLDFLCSKIVGPATVTKDGVRYDRLFYGQDEDAIIRLQGKPVWIRVHPETAAFIDVVDEAGKPIVRAYNRRLTGVTRDDVREAFSRQKRAKRIAKEYKQTAPTLMRDTAVSAVLAAQRRRALAECEDLPLPEDPEVIAAVRPDLKSGVDRLVESANRRAARHDAGGSADSGVSVAFKRLAEAAVREAEEEALQDEASSVAKGFAKLAAQGARYGNAG